MEFRREIQRIERVGVGIDFDCGRSYIVVDERNTFGHSTGMDIRRRNGCVLCECVGDRCSRADTDLDEASEASEACGERASSGVGRGPISVVHVGRFMIAPS